MAERRVVGIRREDKHEWEARVPLTPEAVRTLVERHGLEVIVQPSPIRAFPDERFVEAGARVDEDLSSADVVFAVKEIPATLLRPGKAHVFFSHTIKGQPYNMPLLRRLMELGCTLIDYERIVDAEGRRLVFFGRHAGLAGMIDTLHVLGRRLAWLGHDTPLLGIETANRYPDLDAAREAVARLGETLKTTPLPDALQPFVVGIAGYGAVSKGAQEILDLLRPTRVEPGELAGLRGHGTFAAVFEERHLVEPVADGAPFELQEYYDHPERYRGVFEPFARTMSVLINAIYWTEAYPRLLSKEGLRRWFADDSDPKLKVVGDISCDIDGAIECTVKPTTPGAPAFVYDPATGDVRDGVDGPGLCMMTTDCLPCELPVEASESFTEALMPFVHDIARADLDADFADAGLPPPIASATIVWRGELTPEYRYLEQHLC